MARSILILEFLLAKLETDLDQQRALLAGISDNTEFEVITKTMRQLYNAISSQVDFIETQIGKVKNEIAETPVG